MKKSLLDHTLAISIAKLKTHPEYYGYIHYSFVIQRNEILGYGRNHSGTPPVFWGYHNKFRDSENGPKTHAEIAAYQNCRHRLDKRYAFDIINIRLNRRMEIKLSRPCICCYNLLCELGCRHFYYSSEIGWLKI